MKTYKGLTLIIFFLASCVFQACTDPNEFVIKGTVNQARLEGQWVFLVPMDQEVKKCIGVDSMIIKDMKFEFRGNEEYLGRVTIARSVRRGTQDLLVVTEPGSVINVVIDSISSGGGTPQNEALQTWKDALAENTAILAPQRQHLQYLYQTGDTAYAAALLDSIQQYNENFRQRMVNVAKLVGKGPAYDLLMQQYGGADNK